MLKKAVFPGKYIQGLGAIDELSALINLLGKQGLLLASPSVKDKLLPKCGIDLNSRALPIEEFHGECCEDELARLSAIITQNQVDVLVGMGGGKTIDTAKIVADRAEIPVVVIPTISSTDAPCSGCAVLYSQDGIFESVCFQETNPAVVLVDMGIIAAAPSRFLVAGMGDALSTWFEARSCDRTQSLNECGGYATRAGLQLADASVEESRTVFSFCEDIGLPTTLADIGLRNPGREKLRVAAEKICDPGQPVHHEAGMMTPEKVLDAMVAADALGRARRDSRMNHGAGKL